MSPTDITWTLPHIVAGVMVLSLNAYVLLGGADFGGGVWDLFARGQRRDEQRALIANAIGPIWEANHVWLILVVVLLFTCFPKAFAHLSTELHVPITIMLVGIVLRGSAFTFRTYDSKQDAVQRRWGRIFSMASLLTPIILGVCLGTVASGAVPMRTAKEAAALTFMQRFIDPWFASPFPWAVGLLTLMLFAFLAASYLTVEAPDDALRDLFRRRAQQSQLALLLTAAATLLLARVENPLLFSGLTRGTTALAMHAVTALAAALSLWALGTRRFQVARLAAAAQASFILWGWAWTQFPWILPPDRTITSLAAPHVTLQLTVGALAVGTAILLPSFVYLFRIFKSGETAFGNDQV
ncbi:cytochrome d ubiquinol oxidase subunit II [Gemmatimonas sp.]|uniref:cytochrome d ubiquinol oxidase subunit II n=1 Tax=Gemmatimonas sp. TaxID=1962908 RepID=UPI003341EAED